MSVLDDYMAALKRLEENNPKKVPKGSKINNDTVALEAGRKRGSVKKSRPGFPALIKEIHLASSRQNTALSNALLKSEKIQADAHKYEALYREALNRELMLLHKISQLERKL